LDTLPPESKAILSLLLVQGRSYQEIAEMLHMSPVDVRGRAHTAAQALMGDPGESPSPAGQARIIDYLFGEQSVSERELTRSELTSLDASRAWAKRLATNLSALAKDPLPSIPGPDPAPAEASAPAPAEVSSPAPPAAPAAEPDREQEAPAPAPPGADREPVVPPPPRPAEARSYRPGRGVLAAIVVAVVAAVVVVIVIASGGSSPHTSASVPSVSSPATGTVPATSGSGKTVRRLVLVGTAPGNKEFGAGAVTSQHGKLLLLLQARGMTPNHGNFYGVWLYNAPGDARLLGFVSPPVGANGTFSSSVPLPGDAARFHSLIVTLERTDLAKSQPGPTVLRSPLSLP
jgi:hypothetical protein